MHKSRGLGCLPSPQDERDHVLSMYMAYASIPPSYEAPSVSPLNQGDTPECVGYSGALGRTLTDWRDAGGRVDYDGHDLYGWCKARDGAPGQPGTFIRVACAVLRDTGALVIGGLAGRRTRRKIASYARLLSIGDIKQAVYAYGSAWLGIDWPFNWMTDPGPYLLPKPDAAVGMHAIAIVGWDDVTMAFVVQNSWGDSWGVNGRALLPYRYLDWSNWEAWRTIDAEDHMPTLFVPDTIIGSVKMDADPKTRLQHLYSRQMLDVAPGEILPVYAIGGYRGEYPGDGFVVMKAGEPWFALARNCTFTPLSLPTDAARSVAAAHDFAVSCARVLKATIDKYHV